MAISALKELQDAGQRIFKSRAISRVHRARLAQQGFLREVIKGWLMSIGPQAQEGHTRPWYACFWEFCARYCSDRFGTAWHLSPEQSLLLHAEATAIPAQVIVNSPKGTNNRLNLLFSTSLYDLKVKEMPPAEDLTEKNSLRLYTVDAALLKVSEPFFQCSPVEAQVVLGAVRDVSGVLGRLLDGGHTAVAGRLAGAFRRVGRDGFADDIVKTMKSAGYDVRESDPFAQERHVPAVATGVPPIVACLNAIWESQPQPVLDAFPEAPGLPDDRDRYMKFVDDIYRTDAYHSLSIEGYSVTPELIDRVQQDGWNPQVDEQDRQNRDALAARGYWQAFQSVKKTVGAILEGAPAGALVQEQHRDWYRELFGPSVAAGILRASALAGNRGHPVYLRGSWHVPPRSETVADGMNGLFALLEREAEPAVRGARALACRLRASISRRERPHGALPHERYARLRRLSVGGRARGGPDPVSGVP